MTSRSKVMAIPYWLKSAVSKAKNLSDAQRKRLSIAIVESMREAEAEPRLSRGPRIATLQKLVQEKASLQIEIDNLRQLLAAVLPRKP